MHKTVRHFLKTKNGQKLTVPGPRRRNKMVQNFKMVSFPLLLFIWKMNCGGTETQVWDLFLL